jgi:hypothetical protein
MGRGKCYENTKEILIALEMLKGRTGDDSPQRKPNKVNGVVLDH